MVVVSISSRFERILPPFPKNSQKCKKQASIKTCVVYCLRNENPSQPPPQKINSWNLKIMVFFWNESPLGVKNCEVPCWISASFSHSPAKHPTTKMNPWIGWFYCKRLPSSNVQRFGRLGLPGIRDPVWGMGFVLSDPVTTLKANTTCWKIT